MENYYNTINSKLLEVDLILFSLYTEEEKKYNITYLAFDL